FARRESQSRRRKSRERSDRASVWRFRRKFGYEPGRNQTSDTDNAGTTAKVERREPGGKEMRFLEQVLLTFLLNAAWQVGLIVAFGVVCDWLLRDVAARYRHFLWVAALGACFGVPVLSSVRFARETLSRQSSATEASVRPIVTSRILTPGVEIATGS